MERGLRHCCIRPVLIVDAIIQRPFFVLCKETASACEVFPCVLPFIIIHAMTGIYTTYRQDGAHVTVYITLKEGSLTQTGILTLGTLTSNDAAAFTVEKATGLKVLDASSTDTLFPTVDQNGGTGGSDQGSGNTGNGDGSGSGGCGCSGFGSSFPQP